MDYTKRRHVIMLVSATALLSLAFGALTLVGENINRKTIMAEGSDYALALGESLGLGGATTANALTTSGGTVTIGASTLAAKTGDLGEFAAGGYITNTSAVTGLKSVAIDFDEAGTVNPLKVEFGVMKAGAVDYSIATSSSLSADGTVTVSAQTSYDVAYVKVSNAGTSVSDVKSITLVYTCTKSVTNYQKITYMVEGAEAKTEYLAKGASFASAYVPTLAGYSFKAWTDASGAAVAGTAIDADMTVYSSWYRNVESGVSGAVDKEFHSFSAADGITTTATLGAFSDGGGTITGFAANTTYTFTLPALDFTSALAAGGEVSFDLYSNWKDYTIAGFAVPYEAEHTSTDPYHIMIKANGVGYGLYASATTEGAYGELGTLPSDIVSGTTGMTITVVVGGNPSDVHFTKMVVHALDYKTSIASALSAFASSATVATLAAYETAVLQNLTPYEKTQYSEPSAVTSAKTTLAGQSQTAFAFPTISAYYSSTQAMRTAAAGVGFNTDAYNATGNAADTDYYQWTFQTTSGVTSSYLELPRIAYAAYGMVTFKTWMGAKGSFAVNGTQLEAASDAANQDWGYVIKVVTTTTGTVMTVYHGDGSKGAMTQVQATYTLPSDVANGRIPLHFVEATSTAWTGNTAWGFSNVNAAI
jgi:hypothetical protein